MVWSTGIKQVPLIRNLSSDVSKLPGGRIKIDEYLRVLTEKKESNSSSVDNITSSTTNELIPLSDGTIFALGDCAGHSIKPLPALAQVAGQQGKYLSKLFNYHISDHTTLETISILSSKKAIKPFEYSHFASIASVGKWKGVYDSTNITKTTTSQTTSQTNSVQNAPGVSGFTAFVLWRSAYWTKQVSIVNKILIPMYWFKSAVFGRDISRF